MKVDLLKAYDNVRWSFIRGLLVNLGFPPQFITWIVTCFSSSMFSINTNGELAGYFFSSRGLRQGDPISPKHLCFGDGGFLGSSLGRKVLMTTSIFIGGVRGND